MQTRTRALPVLMLLTALSGACTTLPPQPAANLPYYIGLRQIEATREHLDRYSCGNSAPLYCSCTSKAPGATCRCSCLQ